MIRETFDAENSVISRLDPRTRIISAVLFSVAVAVSTQFNTLLAAFILSLFFVGISKLNLKTMAKRVAVVNGFILLLWVVLPLTFDGTDIFSIGPFSVKREGVMLAAAVTLKSNAILLCFISLVVPVPTFILGHALSRLKVPEKIIYLMLLTYRYLFVIEQEYQRLSTAARVRCFYPKTGLHTYKTYACIIGMIFIRAFEHAERVHQAMRCRGFSGKFFSLYKFSFGRTDVIWSIFTFSLVACLGIMEWIKIIT
jgi:cobalt/nickel transport system permease protein